MQTFLPYADFAESASVLHWQHLGKQRVENMQIMTALVEGRGYIHHPVTKMWAGYEGALLAYHWAICNEWSVVRGYKDTCWGKTLRIAMQMDDLCYELPEWMNDEYVFAAYRSNLMRKKIEHYGMFGWTEPLDLEYHYQIQ